MICPCGSEKQFNACCEPIIKGEAQAANPEAVMRARFTAFSRTDLEFLKNSLEPKQQHEFDVEEIRRWSESSEWKSLKIVKTTLGGADDETGTVEFVAQYITEGQQVYHHELAEFCKEGGQWYFVDGQLVTPEPVKRDAQKVGRNDPCSCGSGKKYKKCCAKK